MIEEAENLPCEEENQKDLFDEAERVCQNQEEEEEIW